MASHQKIYNQLHHKNWKEIITKKCREEVKNRRSHFFNRLRNIGAENTVREIIDSNFNEMVDVDIDSLLSIREEVLKEMTAELSDMEQELNYLYSMEKDQLPCPICKLWHISLDKNRVVCTRCGLSINTQTDCLTLSEIRTNIQSAMDDHSNKNCDFQPEFSKMFQTSTEFLVLQCSKCDFLSICI